ncbi:hypothetical protein L210DRAFT_3579201 [Boletus edulis BED1]|uniref:Secreted protein n=1 Tax=Boletus edulis BED1 TaxID=1328754 RepID=A0AAD4G6I2_BOLED|nr:hypothetical protein L210DRAFT_3579201 [Boletus edulis BED1]
MMLPALLVVCLSRDVYMSVSREMGDVTPCFMDKGAKTFQHSYTHQTIENPHKYCKNPGLHALYMQYRGSTPA